MSSFIVENIPDYSSFKLTYNFDTTPDTVDCQIIVYTDKDSYTSNTPAYNVTVTDISSGDIILPTVLDDSFEKFIDGIYIITLTSKNSGGTTIETLSDKYVIDYNQDVVIGLNTLEVCRQLEEDDNQHLKDAFEAMWGELLLIGFERGAAVGLISNSMGILDYIRKYNNK